MIFPRRSPTETSTLDQARDFCAPTANHAKEKPRELRNRRRKSRSMASREGLTAQEWGQKSDESHGGGAFSHVRR